MDRPSSTCLLTAMYDGLFYTKGSEEFNDWKMSAINPTVIKELEEFVTEQLKDCGPATYVDRAEGSYNMIFRFRFTTGTNVALCIPKPGHTPSALAAEKIANEVAWMRYLKAKTSLPVPNLGDFYIQLNRLPFEKIGSITEDPLSGQWKITQHPLTMDMHQLVLGVPAYPTEEWPTRPLQRSSDYFDFVVAQQHNQLWKLRNLNADQHDEQDVDLEQAAKIARLRFKARLGFKQLIPLFHNQSDDSGPFLPFNPDLDSRNMVIDPNTNRITGIFDLEFSNAMPTQFARDPPLWLHRVLPGQCLEKDFFPWFLQSYQPYLDQFLDAMKRVEARSQARDGEKPLSTLMLESWTSKRCWLNYAAHHADHSDALYWAELRQLHPSGDGPELSPDMESEMESYVEHTKKQIAAYEKAWVAEETVSTA
ncbi:phosphotransferase enzyme family protein [Colletotrichum orchidophilum]|uniref:Phosphotransferase enzyme family protein n=1 Tax=Colletotrichum orchidophilum TaxID=1209926 RepID=A0A1G4AYP8_9PEZI|nr:phosphotransferase enzyme family protein [Colletotrichum orchidophilum]OHE94203.1 phosphotransferase enzyme family protein [Colletotrichum orchidophilum]